jgi:putative transcriptional regulator
MRKSKIIEAMSETARDLELSPITIREIERLNLPEMKTLEANEIKKIRMKEHVSQAVMAKILNVAISTYQKWERGEIQPKGSNLKLLLLAHGHGVKYIVG